MKNIKIKKGHDGHKVEQTLIKALLEFRAKHKLTRKEFAAKINVSPLTLARFESGKARANRLLSNVEMIASGLGLKIMVK